MNAVGSYVLPEAVTFDNLQDVRRQAEAAVDAADPDSILNLAVRDLGHGGSAVVALMIALFRRAHVKGKRICFVDVPLEISNIINVSGLTEVLPLEHPEQGIDSPALAKEQ